MKIVGEKLQDIAISETDSVKQDLFGRSAFNRFYYAAFLEVRKMLGELDPKWKRTPHGNIPQLLEKGVRKPVTNALRESVKGDVITEAESNKRKHELFTSTTDLANLLREAYDIRLIADYEPENIVEVNDKVISLNSLKLTTAISWSNKASSYCKSIRKVWKETGLV